MSNVIRLHFPQDLSRETLSQYMSIYLHSFSTLKTSIKKEFIECIFSDEKEYIELLGQLLFFSHPFESITNDKDEELFEFDFYDKEYLLYDTDEEIELLPETYTLLYEMISLNPTLFSQKKIKIIDPYTTSKILPIETILLIQHQLQNTTRKHLVNKEVFSKPFSLPKTTPSTQVNFTAVVNQQELFKQLREESIKARTKIKLSQFGLDWLDVKYVENQFDCAISNVSNLDFSVKEFDEFLEEYLYQASFVTKSMIGILTPFEINEKIIKKNKLKVTSKKNIEEKWVYILN